MIVIPEGWFWMGSDGHYAWEQPRHLVFVDTFQISPHAVTVVEYGRFLTATAHQQPREWGEPRFSDPAQPVVGANWFDTVAYCDWFSKTTGELYRLPTEAEWEKACRGGCEGTEYAWGNDTPETLPWFRGQWPGPRPVGTWKANGYGLFNMGQNVHEWCSDWFAPDYYAAAVKRNPRGPETGSRRVSRGGSWRHQVKASRSAHRSSLPPINRYTDYGFRLVK